METRELTRTGGGVPDRPHSDPVRRSSRINHLKLGRTRTTPTSKDIEDMRNEIQSKEITFDDIELSEESLGGGSFGDVRSGVWENVKVAVKTLRGSSDAKFLREVMMMTRVNHPRIVRFYGFCMRPKCIVMELVEGGSLKDLLRRKKLHPSTCLRYALDVTKGLCYLHGLEPRIVHRDLKPENILMETSGCKIGDFGISAEVHQPDYGTLCGTNWYMAPEVMLAQQYSEKADIYSFAIVLQEMLTGLEPYSEEKNKGLQLQLQIAKHERRPAWPPAAISSDDAAPASRPPTTKIKTEPGSSIHPPAPPPPPASSSSSSLSSSELSAARIPPSLVKLVESCWSQDPKDRPTIRDILRSLKSLQPTLPPEPPPSPEQQPEETPSRGSTRTSKRPPRAKREKREGRRRGGGHNGSSKRAGAGSKRHRNGGGGEASSAATGRKTRTRPRVVVPEAPWPRQGDLLSLGVSWNCPACGRQNEGKDMRCEGCGARKRREAAKLSAKKLAKVMSSTDGSVEEIEGESVTDEHPKSQMNSIYQDVYRDVRPQTYIYEEDDDDVRMAMALSLSESEKRTREEKPGADVKTTGHSYSKHSVEDEKKGT